MTLMQRLRLFLLKWHRRIGASISLIAIFLAITGIMLNHTEQLALDSRPVQSQWLLSHYGVTAAETHSFKLGEDYLSQIESPQLYWNENILADCRGVLLGAVILGNERYVLCEQELLVLNQQGALIERIGQIHGLPTKPLAIGTRNEALFVRSNTAVYRFSIAALSWTATEAGTKTDGPRGKLNWSTPSLLPESMRPALLANAVVADINIERVILDMHSGRFWGDLGVIVMDVVAVGVILLALSGVWIWSRAKWRRSHYKK